MEYLMLAAFNGESLVNALIWLVVVGLIVWLLWWLITYVGLPEPFAKIARVIIAVVAVVFLIRFLVNFLGTSGL